jgi:hypothetical protein
MPEPVHVSSPISFTFEEKTKIRSKILDNSKINNKKKELLNQQLKTQIKNLFQISYFGPKKDMFVFS